MFSRSRTHPLLISATVALVALTLLVRPVSAAVGVTPAGSGGSISADDATSTWTTLGAITIAEGLNTDIAISQTGATLVLTTPSGFEFNTGQVPDVTGNSTDLSALSMTVPSATTLQLTFTTDGTADALDSVVIGGVTPIQVRPTAGTPLATGNILRTTGAPGDGVIAGIVLDTTNFGTLTMVAGAVAKLGVTTDPATATAGAVFDQQPVVRTEDQYGNASISGLGASLNVTAAINAGSGTLQGTAALDIGTGAGNGTVTHTDLRIDVAQTGTTLKFTATGLTLGSSGAFSVGHATATKLALTTAPSTSTEPGVAFAQQPVVTIQDAYNNTVTSDSTTVVTAALTTGTGTLAGTTTKTAVSGIASFSANSLSIDLAGTDKVLTFSGGALTSVVSGAFTIATPVVSVPPQPPRTNEPGGVKVVLGSTTSTPTSALTSVVVTTTTSTGSNAGVTVPPARCRTDRR